MFNSKMFSKSRKLLKYLKLEKNYHKLRIGCASGFWGDTSAAIPQLIFKGKLDFLVFDYLSEITISLLVKARSVDSTKGFTPDFINIARYASDLKKQGIRVVANAGGINPDACYNELKKAFEKSGVDLKIAVVKGDDLMENKKFLSHLKSQAGINLPKNPFISSNAYLGAGPIKFALDKGADIVITGRCVDSALTLGPLLHHFKWENSDFDKIASGSLAGHLIECGPQVTGGIFTDWSSVPDLWNIGFPIVEVDENSVFVVTKPDNTGGNVTTATVSEQLVYEIDDPACYILPDVICDFTGVTLKEIDNNRIEVRNVKGYSPPKTLKVSSIYQDKYRISSTSIVIGKDAVSKGRLTADSIFKRVRSILKSLNLSDFTRTNVQIIGGDDSYGGFKNSFLSENAREACIFLAAEHDNPIPLKILSSEIAPAGTGMTPGLTLLTGGRPKVTPILKLHNSLFDRNEVKVVVTINSEEFNLEPELIDFSKSFTEKKSKPNPTSSVKSTNTSYTLRDLAYARSGDKGDTCNIGVIARNDDAWNIIKERLTIDIVGSYFSHVFSNNNWHGQIDRYELPGIKALNFVLRNSLDGGGVSSLRIDPQGKAFAQMLLDLKI